MTNINEYITQLSIEEKIGQLFIIDFPTKKVLTSEDIEIIHKYQPGGLTVFTNNVENPEKLNSLIVDFKKYLKVNPFISVDQEGGSVQRLHENVGIPRYPNAKDVLDEKGAYQLGTVIGKAIANLGFNVNFAPVLDIHSNNEKEVFLKRSFGTDAYEVSKKASAFSKGLKDENVIAVGKHFPGIGSLSTDTHRGISNLYKTKEELDKLEFIPFQENIKENIPGIMIGHVNIPNLIKEDKPSTFSKELTDILRNEFNHQGLILTDSLKMRALTDNYTKEEIYINTFLGGNNILLMPSNFVDAYNSIKRALEKGIITEKQIDDALRYSLSVKFNYQIIAEEQAKIR